MRGKLYGAVLEGEIAIRKMMILKRKENSDCRNSLFYLVQPHNNTEGKYQGIQVKEWSISAPEL